MVERDSGLPSLDGQRVLVTGATGGVGQGIAERFGAAGARLVLHSRGGSERSRRALDALVSELSQRGIRAVGVMQDLEAPGAAAALISRARDACEGLDGVVNNAGVQPVDAIEDTSRSAWDAVLATNLSVVADLTRESAASGVQWVTHIASIEASRPAVGHAHYAAAKAGLVMHARAAALELGPRGIRVNTVSPGLVERAGLAEAWPEGYASWLAHAPLQRLVAPADIGNACVFLASAAASAITGHDLVVDAGMLATPGW